MAEKKPRKTTQKAVITDPAKDTSIETSTPIVPNKSYKFMANGKGGMQKDRVYVVSGVVAASLVSKQMGKIIE
jgi:hypothetical protein